MHLRPNFTVEELSCPCCGECKMDNEFMDRLQDLREACGFGFKVTSGYRCEKHNEAVSKKSRGQHSMGLAVDISLTDRYNRRILFDSDINYFRDIAIGDNFVHLGRGMNKRGLGVYA